MDSDSLGRRFKHGLGRRAGQNGRAISEFGGYRCASFDGPALYCSGIRAFDETRGVLVLGSAFGELAVYDLSRSPAGRLEECFQALSPRSVAHESLGAADTDQDLTVSTSVPDFRDTRDHEH